MSDQAGTGPGTHTKHSAENVLGLQASILATV